MKNLNLSIYFAVLVCTSGILMMQGCAYSSRNAILKTSNDADTIKNVFVVNQAENADQEYNLIRPEDELAISNLQDIGLLLRTDKDRYNLRTDSYAIFRVNEQGFVLLPLIGKIKVAGLNRLEAANLIQQQYELHELKSPLIDVRINNAYVVLLGEVAHQGKYIINRQDYELIDLLGEAGGLMNGANKRLVKIFRGDRKNPEVILINMENYSFLKNSNLRLKSRDIIYVEPRRIVANAQNMQVYSTFFQIGFLVINAALLIFNLSN